MGVFRSEDMFHMKIRIPSDNANKILSELGSMEDAIEFIDLTKDDVEAKKTFGSMLKRCDEAITKINDLEKVANDFKIPTHKYHNYYEFQGDLKADIDKSKRLGSTYFDLAETEVIEIDKQIKEQINSLTEIREDLFGLIEKKHVLHKAVELLVEDRDFKASFADVVPGEYNIKQSSTNLNLLTGVIKVTDELKMKRMIFRISHGRAFCTFYDLDINKEEYIFTSSIQQRGFSLANQREFQSSNDLPQGLNLVPGFTCNSKKKIFNIIFPGSEENILQSKILKVCDIFQASRYSIPKNNEIKKEQDIIEREISEKKRVLINIENGINEILQKKIVKRDNQRFGYELYKLFFIQEKMVYITLTKCRIHETFIDGEVWIPKNKYDDVQSRLQTISKGGDDQLTANLKPLEVTDSGYDMLPPTFIQTSEFMWAFQEIVNTYGIPRYKEVNPAYFAVISFPFLFGIMFGDIGHGLIVFIVGAYLCLFNDSLKRNGGNMIKLILKARYILLLMGFFACFCGTCYNEVFSVPLEFFSCYDHGDDGIAIQREGCTYVFGIDPQWLNSKNELTFFNSFKMKFSVIIGVIHMLFGIILKGINAAYNGQGMTFFFSFIPQFILMLSLFGYMDILIVIKWLTKYVGEQTAYAPDIKSMLMNIFLKFGAVDIPLWGKEKVQEHFHLMILGIFVVCSLVMLIPKTLVEYFHAKREYNMKKNELDHHERLIQKENVEDLVEPSFSDFFVNEVIETIEFVLGTVSNTASYLRLWALSLAHSQLSKVFLEQTITNKSILSAFAGNIFVQSFKLYFTYIIWGYLTIGVLLFMDLMECFLHTLRLHWVEFQGKFYKADGYPFKPFSFSQSFNTQNENEEQEVKE